MNGDNKIEFSEYLIMQTGETFSNINRHKFNFETFPRDERRRVWGADLQSCLSGLVDGETQNNILSIIAEYSNE